MKVDVLLGLQWGDEGKGKIVDVLTPGYDIIARFQGGPNAGHTLEFNGSKHVLHTIPSGIFHPDTTNLIGGGVVIDPCIFEGEVKKIRQHGSEPVDNLLISRKSHLILPSHRLLDAALERSKGDAKIGSTLKGIGPAYTDKTARNGLRIGDLKKNDFQARYKEATLRHFNQIKALGYQTSDFQIENQAFEEYEARWQAALDTLLEFRHIDCVYFINEALSKNQRILAEGAQGTLLDIDHGSYPYVTSSNTTTAGVCTGLGIAPSSVGRVFGIFKAYATRVGSGPFPTELNDETGELLRKAGNEFGSTTGRPRRCGWLDIAALQYANMLNGTTHLIMTKADVLTGFEEVNMSFCYNNEKEETLSLTRAEEDPSLKPCYRVFEGWELEPDKIKSWKDFPPALEKYILHIEEKTRLPIAMVSLGADRKLTYQRKEGINV